MAKQFKPKTRNAGTMTESGFWIMIRHALRKRTMYWKPRQLVILNARRENQSTNKRLKWEYQCAECKDWFPSTEVEVDHVEGAGSLKCAADLPLFVERLFCEEDKLRVVCCNCHDKKTYKKEHHESCAN